MSARYHYQDTILLDASDAGEKFIALIRVSIYFFLGIIPFTDYFLFGDTRIEVVITLYIVIIGIVLSLLSFAAATRPHLTQFFRWLALTYDISMVTASLSFYALYSDPVIATNSLVIWQVYGVMIFTSALRLNNRMTIYAGSMAVVQYALMVFLLDYHFELSTKNLSSNEYGKFNWSLQIGRIIILVIITFVAAGFVKRTRKLVTFSGTDVLTGLKNKAYFEHLLPIMLTKSVKRKSPLALAFLDFDFFKKINDQYGHSVGDKALQCVADVLTRHIKAPHLACRWGGEEFILVTQDTSKEETVQLVNQIRLELKDGLEINSELTLNLNLSAGVAECPEESDNPIKLINLADDRMLEAKRAGRDKVVYQ